MPEWIDGAGLEAQVVAALALAAVATSALSAVVGMAGGITLLSVMLLFLEPLVAIPVHGAVQLVSNGSRTWVQRSAVRWEIVWRYAAPLLPLGFLGLALARSLPPEGMRLLIGLFVLCATWLPGLVLLGTHPEQIDPHRRFFWLGGVVGVLNVTLGATGPLIAPFFLNLGLARFEIIGTKAACQFLGHLAKLAVFGAVGFAFGAYLSLLLLLSVCVVLGTWVGSRLLGHVSERVFGWLYKGVLTVIALRLVVVEGWRLAAPLLG